jgi:hypothetical protein
MMRKGAVLPDSDLLKNTADGFETKVLQGERIGVSLRDQKAGKKDEA